MAKYYVIDRQTLEQDLPATLVAFINNASDINVMPWLSESEHRGIWRAGDICFSYRTYVRWLAHNCNANNAGVRATGKGVRMSFADAKRIVDVVAARLVKSSPDTGNVIVIMKNHGGK